MAIRVIVIVEWHWRLDAFDGISILIVALGVSVTLGVCSCVTRRTQICGSTRLVPEVLSVHSDIRCAWSVMSLLLFFPTKANHWYKGWLLWWLWSQTSCCVLGFQNWWQSVLARFVTLASEYHPIIASGIGSVSNLTQRCSMHKKMFVYTVLYILWNGIESCNQYYLIFKGGNPEYPRLVPSTF